MPSLHYPVTSRRLGNGLRVVVSEQHAAPAVTVCVQYDAGLCAEPAGQAGVAHLVEHLMFEGSRNVAAGEHRRLLEAQGAVLNGMTGPDVTVYFEHLPSGALDLALWLEADRMATMPEALTGRALDAQRAVVAREWHERHGAPYGDMLERLTALTFPSGHPYSRTPLGSLDDLRTLTADDVAGFFAAWYAPGRAILAVVGDVVAEAVFQAADRYFGPVPAGVPAGVQPGLALGPLPAPARDDRRAPVAAAAVALGWRLPASSPAALDLISCDLALRVVAGGPASRAGCRLLHESHAVLQAVTETDPRISGNSLGIITAVAMPGVPARQVEDVLAEELDLLAADGPSEPEIDAVRAAAERDVLSVLSASTARAITLAHGIAMADDPHLISTYAARVRSITPAQVQAATREWLRPASAAVVTTSPAPVKEQTR